MRVNGVRVAAERDRRGRARDGDEPLRARRRRDDDRRILADGRLELELDAVDVPLRDDDRARAGVADLLPEALEPRAAGRLGGAGLVAVAECVRLDPEIGDEIGGRSAARASGRSASRPPSTGAPSPAAARPRSPRRRSRRPPPDVRGCRRARARRRMPPPPASATAPSVRRPRCGERRSQARRQRLDDGPPGADDPERAEQRDLRPELRRLRRDQQHREERDRDGVDPAADAPQRGRLRVGDHEEEEDHHLGREHDAPARTRSR